MIRIRFLRAKQNGLLSAFLTSQLQEESERIEFLIRMGAIYVNFIRTTEDQQIQSGDIIRCHTQPKRYMAWTPKESQIVFENDHFIILNKPAGLPCQPGLDNCIENVLAILSDKYKQQLFITHRLDIGTQGLMLISKTKNFQTEFNRLLENRHVNKVYEALCLGPLLPNGRLTHWMRPHARSPKILSRTEVERWKLCELEILEGSTVVASPFKDLSHQRGINHYRLQLLTGRTHQIRAQLAFEANPILGDQVYGGQAHQLPFEWQALHCSELGFTYEGQSFHWRLDSLQEDLLSDLRPSV